MFDLPISAFIICKDERASLGPCLESLSACQEIVIVDSGSTDGTLELIESFAQRGWPIRLFHNEWPGYARQKQFALEQCTSPWCLSLDADERLDDVLQQQLPQLIRDPAISGWKIRRSDRLYGYGYPPAGVHLTPILRLVRRAESTRFDITALVHEGLSVAGQVRLVKRGKLLHDKLIPIESQVQKEARYGFLKAHQRIERGRRSSSARLIFMPIYYFFRIYVLNRYFLCGKAGLVHAMTGAIYSSLTEAVHIEHDLVEKNRES